MVNFWGFFKRNNAPDAVPRTLTIEEHFNRDIRDREWRNISGLQLAIPLESAYAEKFLRYWSSKPEEESTLRRLINNKTSDGTTLFHDLIATPIINIALIDLAMMYGADPRIRSHNSRCNVVDCILDNPFTENKLDCLEIITSRYPQLLNEEHITVTGVHTGTPVFMALYSLQKATENTGAWLLACNIDIHATDKKSGNTFLHMAVKKRHANLVDALIKEGAHINAMDINEETPLMIAARIGDKNIVEKLVQADANIFAQNKDNKDSLYIAREHNHVNIVSFIQEHMDIKTGNNPGL
ncbi:MAG TPA: ankyrin repeat domain-containing protein [Legionellaceae bacterium]|nr:ankyrin repeat domain-containing protein [Legionellaceae bacterium]